MKTFETFKETYLVNESNKSIRDHLVDEEVYDIGMGAGWATLNYVLYDSDSGLNKKERIEVARELSKRKMLYHDDGVKEDNPDREPAKKWRILSNELEQYIKKNIKYIRDN